MSLFGYEPKEVEPEYTRAHHCDGDCPPWWMLLTLHVPVGECTPFPVMMRFRWHLGHRNDAFANVASDGLLH